MFQCKSSVRKDLIRKLGCLSIEEIIKQSASVFNKILKNEVFQNAAVVSIYLNMEKEVHTESLLLEIFKQRKECFIPRFKPGSAEMEMVRLHSMDDYWNLPLNKWNIRQPELNEPRETIFERGQLDLVLVPGLGFTTDGKRIGRGKGYYDKFLTKCTASLPQSPYTIGLAFNEQILPDIPLSPHDIRLGLVIYENSK